MLALAQAPASFPLDPPSHAIWEHQGVFAMVSKKKWKGTEAVASFIEDKTKKYNLTRKPCVV